MSTRARAKKPVFTPTMDTAEKVNLIRSGKKRKLSVDLRRSKILQLLMKVEKSLLFKKKKKLKKQELPNKKETSLSLNQN
jgi:ribosomal protein L13